MNCTLIEINKSLYEFGKDRRGNLCDKEHVSDLGSSISKIEKQARSVACMIIFPEKLEQLPSGKYQLRNMKTLAERIEDAVKNKIKNGFDVKGIDPIVQSENDWIFGESEAFYSEPAPGFGTAFFIGGKKYALTAAHCVCLENSSCLDKDRIKKTKLVFNFKMSEKNGSENTFDEGNVYGIKKVVSHKFCKIQPKWEDWAILELDREVVELKPLEFNYGKKIAKGETLYMLGHPSGLPLKLTKNGRVINGQDPSYFSCHLDAFSGNSGSPVFSLETKKVVGILCGGGEDYEVTDNYRNTGKTRIQSQRTENGYEKCQQIGPLLLEMDLCGALESRLLPKEGIVDFLKSIKNYYKCQKNIFRLLHKQPIPIDVIYKDLVLLPKDSKKLDDEEIQKDEKYRTRSLEDMQDLKVSLGELFEGRGDQNQLLKRLLIVGKAGVGKSTLCQYIAHQWARDKLWKDKFDALFWVPLRQLQDISLNETPASFLFRISCRNPYPLYPSEIMNYIENNKERILFVLDGYDEVDFDCEAQKKIVGSLMQNPYWILTSRPFAAQDIAADAILENVGFTDQSIDLYIENSFPLRLKDQENEAVKNVVEEIRQNSIIFDLCHIPINLDMVSTILERNILDKKKAGFSSIRSMCDLYLELTRTLQRRFLQKIDEKNFSTMEINEIEEELDINEKYSSVFEFLEFSAWIGIKNKKSLFSFDKGEFKELYSKYRPPDLKNRKEFIYNIYQSGFIHSNKKNTEFYKGKHSFLHLTFQEFFAARYLVRSMKSEERESLPKAIRLIKDILLDDPRCKNVLLFIAGLLEHENEKKYLVAFLGLFDVKDVTGFDEKLLSHFSHKKKNILKKINENEKTNTINSFFSATQWFSFVNKKIKGNSSKVLLGTSLSLITSFFLFKRQGLSNRDLESWQPPFPYEVLNT